MDKPEGITSHDVVAFARRVLGESRIGHTGTLDPFATGVLPLACGRATRLVRFMSSSDKSYDATIRFGFVTDTYDITGTEAQRTDARPTEADVREAIAGMLGEQMQTPPPFSAKRVGGHRAYDLARRQAPVELAPARVRLDAAEVVGITPDAVDVRITCSAGYYVRAFAHDLGSRLGTGACLAALRRTRSGRFDIADAVTLTGMDRGEAPVRVLPLQRLLLEFPGVLVHSAGRHRLQHGQTVRPVDVLSALAPSVTTGSSLGTNDGWVRIVDEAGCLIGMGQPVGGGTLRPAIVLI